MAIKGKRKGRSRPRTVAAAPRPFLVPPRTPPLRRRSVQVFLILLLLGGFVALGFGLRASQDSEQRKEAVQQFGSQVEAAFSTSGVVQSFGATPLVLPELPSTVSQLQEREVKNPSKVREQAGTWAKDASELSERIGGIQTESNDLRPARELMEQALALYASIAREIQVAATLDIEPRRALLEPIQQQIEQAREFFDFGWGILTTERQLAEIPVVEQPLVPGLEPGLQP